MYSNWSALLILLVLSPPLHETMVSDRLRVSWTVVLRMGWVE
jgi:hypothetical protein